MTEEQKTKQVIEITTHPKDGRMELEKMANSMLAIKRDYHRWLREKKEKPSNDISLYVEKVGQGSVKLWLAKFKEMGIPVGEYGLNFFQKIKAPENSADQWSLEELKNKRDYLRCNRGNEININLLNLNLGGNFNILKSLLLTSEVIERSLAFIQEVLAAREKKATREENREQTPISFTKYGKDGSAEVIAHDVEHGKDYKANLWESVVMFLGSEKENFFNKRYTANITVRRVLGSGKIRSYVVREIVSPQPSEIPSNVSHKE